MIIPENTPLQHPLVLHLCFEINLNKCSKNYSFKYEYSKWKRVE
jgi:hypothetical protein